MWSSLRQLCSTVTVLQTYISVNIAGPFPHHFISWVKWVMLVLNVDKVGSDSGSGSMMIQMIPQELVLCQWSHFTLVEAEQWPPRSICVIYCKTHCSSVRLGDWCLYSKMNGTVTLFIHNHCDKLCTFATASNFVHFSVSNVCWSPLHCKHIQIF